VAVTVVYSKRSPAKQGKTARQPRAPKQSAVSKSAPSTSESPVTEAAASASAAAAEAPIAIELSARAADVLLVKRCLQGDNDAWKEMYEQCQPKLLLSVRALIGKNGRGVNLAEEITARVWLSLVNADGSLLDRYDSQRGYRLTTFLASLARHELLKYWRSEQRRENRERQALSNRSKTPVVGIDHTKVYWHEFLNTLTHREREFVEKVLLAPPGEEAEEFTRANTWQLRRRIMTKIQRFFGNSGLVGI
jgi:DNA-directed RNA polymerase specialized sigma24 family protein